MPKNEYAWKSGSRVKVDAQKAGQRLGKLNRKEGHLTAEIVLDDAADPTSPLHDQFTWDDGEAAQQYRLDQARHLVRSIVIIRKDEEEAKRPIRAFVQLVDRNDVSEYRDIHVVMRSTSMRQQLLERAAKELDVWRERYEDFVEFSDVFAAIDKTKRRRG